MKNRIVKLKIIVFSIIALSSLIIGCGPDINNKCFIDGKYAPKWVCENVDTDKKIFAVGSMEMTPLSIDFQIKIATANARDALSRKIEIKVKNMIKNYRNSVGNNVGEKVSTIVSKQLSQTILYNSKVEKIWISPKETVFVLVSLPKDKINITNSKIPIDTMNRADKEYNKLDKEIDKNF